VQHRSVAANDQDQVCIIGLPASVSVGQPRRCGIAVVKDETHFRMLPPERHLHLAMPPYWFFLSSGGQKILEDHVHADVTFGVHVPADMPDRPSLYPEELSGRTLLSVPGEEKRILIDGNTK
jgi:hypothetical protein